MTRKRKRDKYNHGDGKDSEGEPSGNQRPKSRGQPTGNLPKSWACPYFRWDPDKHYSCYERYTLTRFSDVIQHLERVHSLKKWCCSNCWEEFECLKDKDGHISSKQCSKRPKPKLLSEDDYKEVRNFIKNQLHQYNSKARWDWVWTELFGPEEMFDSPFIEPELAEPAKILRRKNQPRLEKAIVDFIRSFGVTLDGESLNNSVKIITDIAYSAPPREPSCPQSLDHNGRSVDWASDELNLTITDTETTPKHMTERFDDMNYMNHAALQETTTMLARGQAFDHNTLQPEQSSLFDPLPFQRAIVNGIDCYPSLHTSVSLPQNLDSGVVPCGPLQDINWLVANPFIKPESLPNQVTTVPAMDVGVYTEVSTISGPDLTQAELPPHAVNEHGTTAVDNSNPNPINMIGDIMPPCTPYSSNITWIAGQNWYNNSMLPIQTPSDTASGFAPSNCDLVEDEQDVLAPLTEGNRLFGHVVLNMTSMGDYCSGRPFDSQ